MAAIATLTGYLRLAAPTDVENDANSAVYGVGFVQIERVGEAGGTLQFPITAAAIAAGGFVTGPCTVYIGGTAPTTGLVATLAAYIKGAFPVDVENDANGAVMGHVFAQIERVGEFGGTVECNALASAITTAALPISGNVYISQP
jgi:hypothetical protein